MTMNLGSLMQAMKIQTPRFWIRSHAFPNFFIELQRASLELESSSNARSTEYLIKLPFGWASCSAFSACVRATGAAGRDTSSGWRLLPLDDQRPQLNSDDRGDGQVSDFA